MISIPRSSTQLQTLEVTRSTWLRATAGDPPAEFTNCNPRLIRPRALPLVGAPGRQPGMQKR